MRVMREIGMQALLLTQGEHLCTPSFPRRRESKSVDLPLTVQNLDSRFDRRKSLSGRGNDGVLNFACLAAKVRETLFSKTLYLALTFGNKCLKTLANKRLSIYHDQPA